jgi:hypothetical protein
MIASTRGSCRLRYRLGIYFASSYLVVALLSTAAYLADKHEYSIPMFVVRYASYPVYWIQYDVFRPQLAFVERLPQGELIGFAILIGLTTLLYFAVGQLLACFVKSAGRWVAPGARNEK